jgi:protease-4
LKIKFNAMSFFKSYLATLLAIFTSFFIGIIMLVALVGISASSEGGVPAIEDDSVLSLDLGLPISDYAPAGEDDPLTELLGNPQLSLESILMAIDQAAQDDRIQGISIKDPFALGGWSQVRDIRLALERFRLSGKPVWAYADIYTQKDYYLSSVADSVYLSPVGVLDVKGLAAEVLYYKGFQQKTGLKMEVIRHGKYKSAVEPYLEDQMSEANRSQLSTLLHQLWRTISQEIAQGRGVALEKVNDWATNVSGRTPEKALDAGMIDGLLYADQYDQKWADLTGEDGVEYTSLSRYIRYAQSQRNLKSTDQIAVVYAQGEIMPGPGNQQYIGTQLMEEALEKAVENESVKAIVLRVNSPGGSAMVSEHIWRALKRAQEKKPLVVSMGSVAASGGYYLATAADQVWATPMTITGSIGVFGTIPNWSELSESWGIHAEQVTTHPQAAQYSPFAPMSDGFRSQVQQGIEHTYQTFLTRVSEGRKMTTAQVDSIAQGRVWSAQDALAVGLIDELGSLDEAVAGAAKLAGISDYRVRNYPNYPSFWEEFFTSMEGFQSLVTQVKTAFSGPDQAIAQLQQLPIRAEVYTRMPFGLEVK